MIFAENSDLVGWRSRENAANDDTFIAPWKPEPLDHEQWPPDYKAVYAWRIEQITKLRADPSMLDAAKRYYAKRPAEFIMHWMDTYNPRKATSKWMPFVFFARQADYLQFLQSCVEEKENGLVEKCRDAGVTWLSCGYSVHSWLFIKDDAIGWGSRKQDLVDKLGNPDSIFEKMRQILRRLPQEFLPRGFSMDKHATFMRFINPENNSVIMGEAGDNIGRGGRTRIYFKDESAHYERPEKIEAALGDNTNVQIDISSVNGLGNVFHRRREAGIDWSVGKVIDPGYTRVFIIDWRDHPEKTQEWYDQRKAKYEREGMQHIFAQEVDRNYAAAISNTIIPYEWIDKAVDAHLFIKWRDDKGIMRTGFTEADIPNIWMAGLDVADGGIDRNSLALRQWIIWRDSEEWGERDPGISTRRAIARCRPYKGIRVMYDSIGVGSGVKTEYNRLHIDEKIVTPEQCRFVPWNAGGAVRNPYDRLIENDDDSLLNRDMFQNIKAQAWWSVRTRFYKTFKNITEGVIYPVDELISLDSRMALLSQLKKELAQPTRGESSSLKTIVDKKPDGTKSPNLADAGIQMFFPVEDDNHAIVGSYGA